MRAPKGRLGATLGVCAAFGALACSSKSDATHSGSGAAGGAGGASAGTSATAGVGALGGTAGGGATAGGATAGSGTGAAGASVKLGDLIELVPGAGEVPYSLGENPYGLTGGAFLARSPLGNTIAIGDEAGKICIQGNLDEVPNADYSEYWGVEIGFNLNQHTPSNGEGGAAGAAGAADAAGSDGSAGAPDVTEPWLPGKVVGFSFVIEGPTIGPIRFKSLPAGYDPSLEASVFCKQMSGPSGEPQSALFSQMFQYCWSSASVALPLDTGLENISWQLPADVGTGPRPFDWCLSELRPILAD